MLELFQQILLLLNFSHMCLQILIGCIFLPIFLSTIASILNFDLFLRSILSFSMQFRRIEISPCDKNDVLDFGSIATHNYIEIKIDHEKMINIKLLQQYLTSLQTKNPGVVNNIFLANNQNHILLSTKDRHSQSSILSTFLNDSLYIIRLNLARQDDKNMLELITETDNEYTIIYNIGDMFIYGISVRKDKLNQGRQIATQSLGQVKAHFKEVVYWAEMEP